MNKLKSFKNFGKVALLAPIVLSYNAFAVTKDFGVNKTLTDYQSIVKTGVIAVMAIAVLIFGVQLAIAYFNEQGETVKKKAINFFVGLILFFIILNIDIN